MLLKKIQTILVDCRLAMVVLSVSSTIQASANLDLYRADPAKIQGAENCAECHKPMVEAWKLTRHYSTYLTTHQNDAARTMLRRPSSPRWEFAA
jgi:hypothetical protein